MIGIEQARLEDVEAVCAIDARVIGDGSRRTYLTSCIEQGDCLIAKRLGETVGFAVYAVSFFEQTFLSLVIVDPAHRRRGTARALIRQVERQAVTPKLFTSTNESNVDMQRVLESLGYVRSGIIENWTKGTQSRCISSGLTVWRANDFSLSSSRAIIHAYARDEAGGRRLGLCDIERSIREAAAAAQAEINRIRRGRRRTHRV